MSSVWHHWTHRASYRQSGGRPQALPGDDARWQHRALCGALDLHGGPSSTRRKLGGGDAFHRQRACCSERSTTWGTLITACRTFADVELGELAANALLKLEPQHASAYELLSNIYESVCTCTLIYSITRSWQPFLSREEERSLGSSDSRWHQQLDKNHVDEICRLETVCKLASCSSPRIWFCSWPWRLLINSLDSCAGDVNSVLKWLSGNSR